MQTVLELIHWGTGPRLVDAVSGRGEEYRRHALERMAAAGAAVTNHESVGFEWARQEPPPVQGPLEPPEGRPAGRLKARER